jgi:hypothetical protein
MRNMDFFTPWECLGAYEWKSRADVALIQADNCVGMVNEAASAAS